MKEMLEFILTNITTKPEDISVEEATENDAIHLTVSVNPEDVGRVIGKEGKIIKAIRAIMRVAAIQKGVRVRVTVLSGDEPKVETQENIVLESTESETTEETSQEETTEEPTEDLDSQKPEETPEAEEESLTVEVEEA